MNRVAPLALVVSVPATKSQLPLHGSYPVHLPMEQALRVDVMRKIVICEISRPSVPLPCVRNTSVQRLCFGSGADSESHTRMNLRSCDGLFPSLSQIGFQLL
jgi:hypothetical protein